MTSKSNGIVGRILHVLPTRPGLAQVHHHMCFFAYPSYTRPAHDVFGFWGSYTDRLFDRFEIECFTISLPRAIARCLISSRIVLSILCHKKGSQGLVKNQKSLSWAWCVLPVHLLGYESVAGNWHPFSSPMARKLDADFRLWDCVFKEGK